MASDESPTPSPSPQPSVTSDKENRQTLSMRNKGPIFQGPQKRKPAYEPGGEPSRSKRRTEASALEDSDEDVFDPDQPREQRRELQRGFRELKRDLQENQDEYLHDDGSKLIGFFDTSDRLLDGVKQTSEAAIEARGLLLAADLQVKRIQRMVTGNVRNGIDVDEFVSKCITFMLQARGIEDDNAPQLSSTQRRRRRPNRGAIGSDDEDSENGNGDLLSWEHFGRFASLPNVNRPAVSGFLLGPLSIKKKLRKVVERTERLRINNLREVRPEVLKAEDLVNTEKNDLTAICSKICKTLQRVQQEAQDGVEDELEESMTDDEIRRLMDKYGLRSTGGIDLLKFIANPHSFAQTVENMFYISFLIRDGFVKLEFDNDEMPTLGFVDKEESAQENARRGGTIRHQAVMSIDMKTWRDIIEVYNINKPMIEHRREQVQSTGPGARGWYS